MRDRGGARDRGGTRDRGGAVRLTKILIELVVQSSKSYFS